MNCITGAIVAVHHQESIVLVDVSCKGLLLSALQLDNREMPQRWQAGQEVNVLFNETEVALAKNLNGELSMRNRLPGKIIAIEHGEVLCRVLFELDGAANEKISAVITARSALAMRLQVADPIEGLVKSTEMNLQAIRLAAS